MSITRGSSPLVDAPSAVLSPSRKRKRSTPSLPFNPLTIHDPVAPITLHPHLVIPRNCLPFSLLDLSHPDDTPLASRSFVSDDDSLSLCLTQNSFPSLVVAGTSQHSQLYAIELVTGHLFALHRLSAGATLEGIHNHVQISSKLSRHSSDQDAPTSKACGNAWWQSTIYEVVEDQCREPASGNDPVPIKSTLDIAQHVQSQELDPVNPLCEPHESVPTLEQACKDIVLQYLEVLYLSKASVAYFAKSTLSRARAFVDASQDETVTRQALAVAIRDMIFTRSTFEKRYESRLLDCLKLKLQADVATDTGPPRKAKQLKKPKPGKDGVYIVEPDYLAKWWQSENNSILDAADTATKRELSKLRFREGLLQVILLLEVLALEDGAGGMAKPERPHVAAETQPPEPSAGDSQPQKPPRAKKAKDLGLALETLVDKVCIWDSIESFTESPSKSQASSSDQGSQTAVQNGRSDRLKQFCVDVLLPFYSPRLPRKVKEIADRMGVSIATPVSTRSDQSSRKRKAAPAPGSEIRRHPFQSKRRQLERVSSEHNRVQGMKAPSLLRSSTDTFLLQDVKRERSSTPQDDVLSHRRTLSRTSSLSSSKAFQQRTVDLSALNQFKANKEKQKAAVEQELKDAIAVLKKPNRTGTAKEFADAAAHRAPARNARASRSRLAVEIGVTPRRGTRATDLAFAKPAPFKPTAASCSSPEVVAGSGNMVVPSSTTKPAMVRRSNFSNIFETPSRGPAKTIDALGQETAVESPDEDTVPQSVIKESSETSRSLAESKASMAQPDFVKPGSWLDTQVASTPVKGAASKPTVAVDTRVESGSTASKSIYDVLGWNDDDDEIDELL